MNSTVSGILVATLMKRRIRHICGLPAAQLGLVIDGASQDPYFRDATARHEEAAGCIAHAVHPVRGEMALLDARTDFLSFDGHVLAGGGDAGRKVDSGDVEVCCFG